MIFSNMLLAEPIKNHLDALLLKHGFSDSYSLSKLRKEASSRSYYRLDFDDGDIESIVLCHTLPIPSPGNDDFLKISQYLFDKQINVPRIYGINESEGLILQENAGDTDLTSALELISNGSDQRLRLELLYKAADILASLHSVDPVSPVSERFFDRDKLQWEMNFLFSHMSNAIGLEISAIVKSEFIKYVNHICDSLSSTSNLVFTHRDFHGRNIMVRSQDTHNDFYNVKLTMIDYQDARLGVPWYDLVSLVYDPYTPILRLERMQTVAYYTRITDREDNEQLFYYQAIQRLLKAMGSYFFLSYEKGMNHYKQYIPITLDIIDDIVQSADLPEIISEFTESVRKHLE